jgi:molecular chaperone DnaK
VNPVVVVAVVAAVQGGVLAGDVKDVLLLDVTPLSLGIETLGGVMTKLIEKNTTIPTRRSQTFSTAADSQPQVEIHVLQGERDMASGNRTLGRFILDGIPPAPRGVPQVEVTFDIDANGILSVSARDKASAKEQSIRIEGSGGLAQTEIDRMVREAESHASEDKAQRDLIEKRNTLDNMIYQAEKTLRENAEKVPGAEAEAVQKALEAAKKELESQDADKLESARQNLEQQLHRLAETLYKAQSAAGAGAGAPGPEAPPPGADDADVVDAEYTEEKGKG